MHWCNPPFLTEVKPAIRLPLERLRARRRETSFFEQRIEHASSEAGARQQEHGASHLSLMWFRRCDTLGQG